ncbi:MAG TPA: MFS transporter [Ktedonobacterales bacterium]|nr:MFS transporter [Ktedonobacterales bacterium]
MFSSRLWRNRDYRLLTSGQAVSALGTNISQLAFPLFMLLFTGSAAQAGFAGALRALPYFLFGLPAGALIDRWDRKRVMIACDIGRALSLASIPIAYMGGWLTIPQLYTTAFIEGTLYVFFDLAEAAALPRVVAREDLPQATAQSATVSSFAQLLGSPLGGLLFSIARTLPFVTDAISYGISALTLTLMRTRFQEKREAPGQTLWARIGEGLAWLRQHPNLRMLAFLTGGVNFIFPECSTLVLMVLAGSLNVPAADIGLLITTVGVGCLIGSLVSGWLGTRLSLALVIAGSCWLFALVWPLLALAQSLIEVGGVALTIGIIDPIYDVAQFSYRSARIPDNLQGRVNSAYRLVALGTPPIGLALCGVSLEILGPHWTVLLFTPALVAVALAATLNRRLFSDSDGSHNYATSLEEQAM